MTSPAPDRVPDLVAQDFVRTYTLDGRIEATIPTTPVPGEPGIHWVARGLLSEVCDRLLAEPISLACLHGQRVTFVSVTMSLASTVVSPDRRNVLATVNLALDRLTSRWVLIFWDRIVGTGGWLPSPSYLAELVAVEHDRARRPLDFSQGPDALPEPLW